MSPKKLLELFEGYHLQRLEVLVGQKIDLRNKVSSPEIVDELEPRKEANDFVLYVSPDHDLHTKLYIIEKENRLFRWFSRVYLDQEVRISELQDDQGERDDMLVPVRLARHATLSGSRARTSHVLPRAPC